MHRQEQIGQSHCIFIGAMYVRLNIWRYLRKRVVSNNLLIATKLNILLTFIYQASSNHIWSLKSNKQTTIHFLQNQISQFTHLVLLVL